MEGTMAHKGTPSKNSRRMSPLDREDRTQIERMKRHAKKQAKGK
jgi:hypothetical protein